MMQALNSRFPGRVSLLAMCILSLALVAGGCAKAQAKAAPDGPPLSVPAPPPRVLAPVEEEPLADNPPPPEPVAATPPRTTTRPAPPPPPRRPAPTPATTTTEPEQKQDPAAAQTSPVPAETPATAPRPATTPADNTAITKVRDTLTHASEDLKKVNYQRLSADGRAQYDRSKQFADQAEQALKDRNYAFAITLADKAAALATELLAAR